MTANHPLLSHLVSDSPPCFSVGTVAVTAPSSPAIFFLIQKYFGKMKCVCQFAKQHDSVSLCSLYPKPKNAALIASVSTTHAIPSIKRHKGGEESSEGFCLPVPYQKDHFLPCIHCASLTSVPDSFV